VKKILRFILYLIGIVLSIVVIALLITVIPVDRTPYRQQEFYRIMTNRLDSLDANKKNPTVGNFKVGFAMRNLTPENPVSTAGYPKRRGKVYPSVLDSIFVRAIVIDNGKERVAIVSADLLIIPPTVTLRLKDQLPSIGFSLENTYLNATHTHNSIGNWGEGATGMIYGSYNDSIVSFIADKIVACVKAASLNGRRAVLKTAAIPVPGAVKNRLDKESGHVDSLLRVVEIKRDDSLKLIMVSYNAHPTCLFARDLVLSRDYPGQLVDQLEANGYDFALFLAGAVGSHGCNPPEYGTRCISWMAEEITSKFTLGKSSLTEVKDSSLQMVRVPLALGEPQVKLTQDWRIRPWVFTRSFGEYTPYLTALRIGDLVLLGTPCDFSGELSASIDSVAVAHHVKTIVTSFNGHYIGYITRDIYYNNPHYETRLMNWYGPGNGAYISECLEKLLQTMAEHRTENISQ
jgi:neutral ceramidase